MKKTTQDAITASRDTDTKPPTSRGARRKQRTRAKLLRAAMQLMAERGMEGVAINEVTEAADVGFGSFYNHFDSKEAIYQALVNEVFDAYGISMQKIAEAFNDPAEVVAASIRYTLERAESDPVWGRFLSRTGLTGQLISHGLGRHLLRDLQRGRDQQRFDFDDPLMALVVSGGAVMAAVSVALDINQPGTGAYEQARLLGLELEDLPARTSAAVLRALGVNQDEASEIAHRPLPEFEFQELAD